MSVASQMLCCRGSRQCSKTTALARKLPTIDPEVQSVVFGAAGDPHSGVESTCRAMLFEVEAEGESALADRIVSADPDLALSQMEYALQAGVFSGPTTQLVVGGLVASMLVGTEIRPQEELGVSPVAIGRALRKASADSVAVFAAGNRPLDDPLDAGIYALSKFFRKRRLGAMQLARWAAAVSPDCESFEGERSSSWPPPRGWNAVREMAVSGDVTPLLSIGAIVQEGVDMRNCLARGHYNDRAAAGRVHVFSLHAPQRATLALAEHRDGCRVVGYEIVELKARRNGEPRSATQQRAEALVAALHEGLSIEGGEIDPNELERRGKSTRSFIADTAVAVRLWSALARSLPARFRAYSPQRIAEEGDR